MEQRRKLFYVASSNKDVDKLPTEVKELFSEAMEWALRGETHPDAKMFKYHGSGIYEVVANCLSSTFREIYTVRFSEAVYVLHIFQKKSKKGSKTPKTEIDLIKQRIKIAEQDYKERYGKNK